MDISDIPDELPIISIEQDVLLPGSIMRIDILKDFEIAVLEYILTKGCKVIGIVPVLDENEVLKENQIGTVATLLQISASNIPGRTSFITLLGLKRFVIKNILHTSPFQKAEIRVHQDAIDKVDEETMRTLETLKKVLVPVIQKLNSIPLSYMQYFKRMISKFPIFLLIDIFISLIPSTFDEKLDILNTLDISERMSKGIPIVLRHLGLETNVEDLKKIVEKPGGITVFKVIKPHSAKELPDYDDKELGELQRKLQNAKLPEYAMKQVLKDISRLKRMNHFSPDHYLVRNYLEFVADLPWSVSSKETLDIIVAREELDKDHYGMEKLKKRILEYLAVRQLKSDIKGPILCFVGPPGVGKTSIGRSIARILNKKFQRISLGGVSNQSEIRGHRRTYIGALPGRVLQAIKNAGTNNPVILFDEIDKLGFGVNGDPRAALLEVLDPEQNSNFTDHYLGMPFDLSQVTFIATANSIKTIPLPLLDRMEIISVAGYTPVEKFQIANQHLLPKQLEMHGLSNEVLQLSEEALQAIIAEYTKEAGVRSLERKLAAVCRSVAVRVAELSCQTLPIIIEKEDLEDILGMAPYLDDEILKVPLKPGVALGLACTGSGGSVMSVEVTRLPGGKGELILTGCVGKVMKESARIALNWVRSIAPKYEIIEENCDLMADSDLHIHFPSGAISKEGPSAGAAIACAILSLFTGIPVASGLAMTGEITLQGIVLPVGGIKEKLNAAHRLGISKVILPYKCKKELVDVSSNVLDSLEIVLAEKMTDVIEHAFDGSLIARANDSVLCSKL